MIRVISFFFVALGVIACLALWGVSETAVSKSDKIIDAHVHLGFDNKVQAASGIMNSKEEFLKGARAAGVTGFVAHTHSDESPTPDMPGLAPTYCVGVHDLVKLDVIEEGLRSGRYKCIKIYLGYTYKYPYDEAYKPLYTMAAQMKVPVVFHTGDTETKNGLVKYAHPLNVDEVAVEFPHTTFVMAHVGNPWFDSAAEVAYKNDNVYVDVSGILIGDLNRFHQDDFDKYLILCSEQIGRS